MKSFLKVKSVGSGMVQLLHEFCEQNHLKSPVNHIYAVNDRIPLSRWLRKIQYVDEQYNKEGLGLEIATLCTTHHLGIVGYILNSCHSISDYFALSRKYNSIWYNFTPKKFILLEDEICVYWEKPTYYALGLYVRETAISEELQVAIFYQYILKMIQPKYKVFNQVELAIPQPGNPVLYEQYFGCPVKFNCARTRFHIPKTILEHSIASEDPVLFEILKQQADVLLKSLPSNVSFLEHVNSAIIHSIRKQNPKMSEVAQILDITPRVLQIELRKYGICFQELLNEARLTLAKEYLRENKLTVMQISDLLGYQEQTSFNKLFKRKTKLSPVQWREKALGKSQH